MRTKFVGGREKTKIKKRMTPQEKKEMSQRQRTMRACVSQSSKMKKMSKLTNKENVTPGRAKR